MKVWTVKFKSVNAQDYYETVSANNEQEARKAAQRMTVKHDDRDYVMWVKEDTSDGLGGLYAGK